MLEQQSSQGIDGESYSKKKKAKKKKKRLKDIQSHDDTLLSSLSASDMSHSEGTVTLQVLHSLNPVRGRGETRTEMQQGQVMHQSMHHLQKQSREGIFRTVKVVAGLNVRYQLCV